MSRSLLFSCRKATQAVSEALDHPLPINKLVLLQLHLAMCSACRTYRLQVRGFDRALRLRLRQPTRETLTPSERERLVRRLKIG